jgi:hypothetical protein
MSKFLQTNRSVNHQALGATYSASGNATAVQ